MLTYSASINQIQDEIRRLEAIPERQRTEPQEQELSDAQNLLYLKEIERIEVIPKRQRTVQQNINLTQYRAQVLKRLLDEQFLFSNQGVYADDEMMPWVTGIYFLIVFLRFRPKATEDLFKKLEEFEKEYADPIKKFFVDELLPLKRYRKRLLPKAYANIILDHVERAQTLSKEYIQHHEQKLYEIWQPWVEKHLPITVRSAQESNFIVKMLIAVSLEQKLIVPMIDELAPHFDYSQPQTWHRDPNFAQRAMSNKGVPTPEGLNVIDFLAEKYGLTDPCAYHALRITSIHKALGLTRKDARKRIREAYDSLPANSRLYKEEAQLKHGYSFMRIRIDNARQADVRLEFNELANLYRNEALEALAKYYNHDGSYDLCAACKDNVSKSLLTRFFPDQTIRAAVKDKLNAVFPREKEKPNSPWEEHISDEYLPDLDVVFNLVRKKGPKKLP